MSNSDRGLKADLEFEDVGKICAVQVDAMSPRSVRRTNELQLKVVEVTVRLTIRELGHSLKSKKSVLETQNQESRSRVRQLKIQHHKQKLKTPKGNVTPYYRQ